jgi:hypothetical protein
MLMQCANVLNVETVEMADGLSASQRLGISQMLVPRGIFMTWYPHYIGTPVDNKATPASTSANWY